MAITRIQFQSNCPYGHDNIEFGGIINKYIFCYKCNKRFYEEDFEV